jgi:hypothetical protein
VNHKRTLSITVKIAPKEWLAFKSCVGVLPEMPFTNSNIMLYLARIGCKTLSKKKGKG